MHSIRGLADLTIVLSLAVGCAAQSTLPPGRWIDLTYDFSNDTVYWPTAKPFKLETVFEGFTTKGYYYSAYQFSAAEHGGTHIDAPVHFAVGKRTLDQIPVDQLIGPAIVIEVSKKALNNRDYQISVDDLITWEEVNGRIPNGTIVLLRTGYGQYWLDRARYMGTGRRGSEAVPELHFPGLHPDAARWLVINRKIHAIGLDTPSIDYGQSELFESHQILFAQNIPAMENLARLDALPTKGAWVVALPMKIKGGSGGPLRIVARLP